MKVVMIVVMIVVCSQLAALTGQVCPHVRADTWARAHMGTDTDCGLSWIDGVECVESIHG